MSETNSEWEREREREREKDMAVESCFCAHVENVLHSVVRTVHFNLETQLINQHKQQTNP